MATATAPRILTVVDGEFLQVPLGRATGFPPGARADLALLPDGSLVIEPCTHPEHAAPMPTSGGYTGLDVTRCEACHEACASDGEPSGWVRLHWRDSADEWACSYECATALLHPEPAP